MTKPNEVVGGRYRLIGMAGAGGMGTVYRAQDLELDEEVAIKVLRPEVADQPSLLERFRREVKLARRISHKNVARTFDIGEHQGEKFLTMEFVDGHPLSQLLADSKRLVLGQAVEIVEGICAGLSAAHEAGVVHRDLKPENVIIEHGGRVVITDFGIARSMEWGEAHTTVGTVAGTPAYMSPEQVSGQPIDTRSDLYSLGVMMFQMVTGTLPWTGATAFLVAAARLDADPPDPRARRPDLPDPVVNVIMRLMAPEPSRRFERADQVLEVLGMMTMPSLSAVEITPVTVRGRALNVGRPSMLPAPAFKAVAVLPLHNAGPADDEYLADGLTEEIIDGLSMVRGLRVRSRSSVVAIERGLDPRQVGSELQVHVVVEGSVRRMGNQLRISTRLISVEDGFQLWAQRFQCSDADVFAVADEAASAIAQAMGVRGESPARTRQAPSADALELYLRGRHEYHRMRRGSTGAAIDLFERALAVAPEQPTILAGYAMARIRQFFIGDGGDDALNKGREAAERAVELAPNLAEPHVALASVLVHEARLPEAVRELGKAVAIAPNLAEAQENLGRLCVEAGMIEAGIRHLEAALAIEPTLAARWDLPRAYALSGNFERARELVQSWSQSSTLADGGLSWMGRLRLALWARDRDWMAELAAELDDASGSLAAMGPLMDMLLRGDKVPQLPRIGPLAATGGWRQRAFYHQIHAELCAFIGDQEGALSAIEAACAAGLIDRAWIEHCPLLDDLRDKERWISACATVAFRTDPICAALMRESTG